MRIAVLCASDDVTWEMMALTAANRTEYCMRHRYHLQLIKYLSFKHFVMEKEIQICNQLRYCDWLLFMGVDTCFTNMTIGLEDLIEKHKDSFMVIGKDVNGINNDVMLIRSCSEAHTFLGAVIGLHEQFENDQHAMANLLNQDDTGVAVIHQKAINAMPYWLYPYPDDKGGCWEEGDFIFHAAGLPFETRMNVLKEVMQKVTR
jgi:hypothetical protein